ncbi:hypothetical protein EDB83DRAFT_2555364 [Lactarius deliciosus]|nr:hypothetical protein EDB83DRAFT_2555364 [Lactarius deliciosus]
MFVCALVSFGGGPEGPGPILSAVQLLWIHIIMDIGTLALAMDPASPVLLDRNPNKMDLLTLIFDMFVFAEIFNSVNCRRLDRKLNVLDVEELAFDVTYMGAREWCISIALGCVSPLLGALIHFIPDEICESAFKELQLLLPEPESLNLSKR